MVLAALLTSLKVMALAVPLFALPGLALALLLARARFPGRSLLETAVLLPLVLPPSAVGYYLLLLLGRSGPLERWLGLDLLFSWPAASLAAAVVALPLMVQASKAGIAAVDRTLEDAARTLGASEAAVLLRVTLPLARRAILAGLVLGTTRALGEFGATLMVAGNIPGRTQTLPLALYEAVQDRRYALANGLSLLLTALAFLGLWLVRRFEEEARRRPEEKG